MIKWLIGAVATIAFLWGLTAVLDALTCSGGWEYCSTEIVLGVIGVSLAGLSFAYLAFLLGQVQKSI
jgi:hypothetical protein